ncbi:glycosyltransferase involved in cell wall biosynthesis [Dysgonomonas sp. PH5-45]|uniref:glycosyltransferase n=1 Tax=unclassified Dysgonomonas TaxID=2630389 RepID=UPI0024746819|nr:MULTISPECIES: glycosyltransferase [unclassified Dysgonomonas]MDH6354387.1 glycosyltransferase involved in cell wall biosynthesis [Dysgonomonas sp. PH5-45]MDH6387286.1 glycosyltransferase involved in cell wall biosynthesis [Dysgonomonas sp. PH5-37]
MKNNSTKKNLCIFTLSMGSGGAERFISLIIPPLTKKYNITLVLFNQNIHYSLPENVSIVYLNSKKKQSFVRKIFSFIPMIYKYVSFIKKNDIPVAMSFLTRPNIINGICKIFCPKTKIIISERAYPSLAYSNSFKGRLLLYKVLIPLFYNKADLLFSNSVYINDDLISNFRLRIPSFVIYNPVIMPSKKAAVNNETSYLKIINVGSLVSRKNQKLILEALAISKNSYKMTIVGDGETKNSLIELSKKLNIERNVDFVGRSSHVGDFLSDNECFILSSNAEGFPNVILEAMSYGLTIISTNCMSGPLELLNENVAVYIPQGDFVIAKYGILVNTNDSEGLTKAIDYVATNREFRISMHNASIQRANNYSLENIVDELVDIIE